MRFIMHGTGTLCLLLTLMFKPGTPQVSSPAHCLWPTSSGPCEYCERGWYGDRCENKCTGQCDIGGCHRHNGTCHQCSHGYYATHCTTTCPTHCRESYDRNVYCDRETGKCLENCEHDWWGDWCNKTCSDGCVDNNCMFYNGSCTKGCKNGWWGEKCDVKCPENCMSTDNGTDCHQETGGCLKGCKRLWTGEWCYKHCIGHCIQNNCHTDGSCIEGCQQGWAGHSCKTECPSGCLHDTCASYGSHICTQGCKRGLYGLKCDKRCNQHCTDQKCFFNHTLGSAVCTHGCINGWWSHNCQKTCPKHCTTCLRDTGYCPTRICYSCAHTTDKSRCNDRYFPVGHEIEACEEIDPDLCQRYDGGYSIYCTLGGIQTQCHQVASPGPCPNEAKISNPPYLTPSLRPGTGVCYSCAHTTDKSRCNDFYVPVGHELEACEEIDPDLCQRYDGGYSIYCTLGGIQTQCHQVTSPGPCPNEAKRFHPMYLTISLTSGLVAIVTRLHYA